ncbi:helix-turn-helix transcriptional regulator [Telmatobacter sp. DSM 110680]|uniref:Helix-turn-helix transcriptional regulator n=1 Tax=Telmatobacter sp. DSM 110680 TaxID=3036704 RepID=A0AAU7DDI9_9BACT
MSTIVDIYLAPSSNHVGVSAEIKTRFGARLRALRASRGWTQAEMADLLAINRGYLSQLETGQRDPSLTVLQTLADGLSITLSHLLKGL